MLRLGLQGPSRPQELCAGTLPGHDAGRCGTGRRRGACGAGKPGGRAVSVTAPIPAVRGQVFSCPWLSGSRGARRCSGWWWPETCLAARIRWSARLTRVEGERSVKPSAQPTLVRTQHLPPPAETAPWLRKRARGAVFVLVTSRIRVCHCASRCRGAHGRIADVVRAGSAVGDTVGFPRTATDGPGKRGLVPAQVRCRCHAPPDGRHRPGRAGAAAAEGRAVRHTAASAARGASGQLLYWRGCPSRLSLNVIHPGRPGGPDPSRTMLLCLSRGSDDISVAAVLGLRVVFRPGYCWFADKTGMGRSRWSAQALIRSVRHEVARGEWLR